MAEGSIAAIDQPAIPVRDLLHEWGRMATAPKDAPIRVAVKGSDGLGFSWHELPHLVIWHEGRWCYATNRAPVFPWHQPIRWKPA